MLPGVILAAGDSTRMGSPKALLLTPDGKPFVAAIVATFAAAGIADIVVGHRPRSRSNRRGARERAPAGLSPYRSQT